MPKRPFPEVISDLVDELTPIVLSTVEKYAKTVDYTPLLEFVTAATTMMSAHADAKRAKREDDSQGLGNLLTQLKEKMLTLNKDDGGDASDDDGECPPDTGGDCKETASQEDDYGEAETQGLRCAPTLSESSGANGCEDTREKGHDGTG